MIRTLVIATAAAAMLPAQSHAQASSDTHLDSAISVVRRNPVMAVMGSGAMTRVRTVAERPGNCSLKVTKTGEGSINDTREATVELRDITPDLEVKPWTDGTAWSVTLRTSSGAETIPYAALAGEQTGRSGTMRHLEVNFQTETSARAFGAALAAAVRGCNGQPLTASARRLIDEAEGRDPATMAAKTVCRQLVIAQLKDPSSGQIEDSSFLVVPSADGGMSLHGKVSGRNSLGGTVTKSFFCTFTREGDTWVPKSTPLMY